MLLLIFLPNVGMGGLGTGQGVAADAGRSRIIYAGAKRR